MADAGGQGRRTDDADVSGHPLHACVPVLDRFFRPDSLAVVGAADAEGRPDTGITRQLATRAVGARLHPVDPGRAGVVLAADTANFIEVFVRRGLVR